MHRLTVTSQRPSDAGAVTLLTAPPGDIYARVFTSARSLRSEHATLVWSESVCVCVWVSWRHGGVLSGGWAAAVAVVMARRAGLHHVDGVHLPHGRVHELVAGGCAAVAGRAHHPAVARRQARLLGGPFPPSSLRARSSACLSLSTFFDISGQLHTWSSTSRHRPWAHHTRLVTFSSVLSRPWGPLDEWLWGRSNTATPVDLLRLGASGCVCVMDLSTVEANQRRAQPVGERAVVPRVRAHPPPARRRVRLRLHHRRERLPGPSPSPPSALPLPHRPPLALEGETTQCV